MAVAIFGGTFNPVHIGHLRIATELAETLQVESIGLMPCAFPPHRGMPGATAEERLAMLEAAVADYSLLRTEDIELQREAPSYSIDTLLLLRQKIGQQEPLFLCVGMDTLNQLDNWHRWQELLQHCHIVVSSRPGWTAPNSGALSDWLAANHCDDLSAMHQRPSGQVYICDLTLLEVSSTSLREKIKRGDNIDFLTPKPVVEYIQQHHLYE